MPLAAVVDRLAPPARAVVVPAAENVPTVRTAVGASTRKSAGRVEAVVAVAGMPMPSKFCVDAVLVDSGMAANATKLPTASASARYALNTNLLRATKRKSEDGSATLFDLARDGSGIICLDPQVKCALLAHHFLHAEQPTL